MIFLNLIIAFNLGILSTLHCLGMCGGIVSALSIAMPDDVNKNIYKRSKIILGYNIGRITSYTIAGTIAGASSGVVILVFDPQYAHRLLQFLAAIILILIGLNLAGWLSLSNKFDGIGIRLWRHIQPLVRNLIPVNGFIPAFKTGILWGWLPCALVYSVLLWALVSGSAFRGGLLMFFFGLGTLPSMITAGSLSSSLFEHFRKTKIRKIAAVIIIIFGLASPFIQLQHKHAHTIHETALD